MRLIDTAISDDVIKAAFEWVCKLRRDYSHNSDIGELRRYWCEVLAALKVK